MANALIKKRGGGLALSSQFILGAWNQVQMTTCRVGHKLLGLSAGSSILKRNGDLG
jgi:cystathionine beta-lyase family protein involved in aluminum resistance